MNTDLSTVHRRKSVAEQTIINVQFRVLSCGPDYPKGSQPPMRKLAFLLLLIPCASVSLHAQVTRLQARDAEWKGYSLPQTNFTRQIDPNKNLIFRVPADWKQESLLFTGPHSSTIRVGVDTVPDGYPLQEYFASLLQTVKDSPGVVDSTLTRKTQLQDLEAREIFVELTTPDGETVRVTSWVTVVGPLAVIFTFQAPVAHAAEVEPFFKALLQSVIFVSNDYPAFESLRSAAIKAPAPGPIHEIASLVA